MWNPEDAETRRNALALHKAWREAEKAYEESGEDEPELPEAGRAEIDLVWAEFRLKMKELTDIRDARIAEIHGKYLPNAPSKLRAAMEAAEQAYMDAPGDGLLENGWKGEAVICAKSGLPIYDTDEIVEDNETGEYFLRAALGLPPRPVEEEEVEEAA